MIVRFSSVAMLCLATALSSATSYAADGFPSKPIRIIVGAAPGAAELPQVPTMKESGCPDFEVTGWFGLFASAKTPPVAIERIYRAASTVLASPEIKARFAELGGTAGGEPPEQFRKFVAGERQKWAQVAAAAKIQPE